MLSVEMPMDCGEPSKKSAHALYKLVAGAAGATVRRGREVNHSQRRDTPAKSEAAARTKRSLRLEVVNGKVLILATEAE